MVKELQEGLQEGLRQLPPELQRMQELQRLWELRGLPHVLLGELQELLAPQEQLEKTGTEA